MTIQKNIAATLKTAMVERDLNLVEFAEEIGIARTSLQGYLKEESNPRVDTIELLSKKLNISPAALISGPDAQMSGPDQLSRESLHPSLIPMVRYCHEMIAEIYRLSSVLIQMETQIGGEQV